MEESREQQCRDIVLQTLAKRDWQLIENPDLFAGRIYAELDTTQICDAVKERRLIERATVRQYCAILHTAAGAHGTRDQRRAFQELWNYLYRIAAYKISSPVLAQDLAQQTLGKTWKSYAQCRDPHNFLGWATMILLNEIREFYRAQKRQSLPADAGAVDPEITEGDLAHDADADSEMAQAIGVSADTTLDDLMQNETHQELRVILAECLKNRQQQTIILESFFNAKGYKEIAEQLGISVTNVHVQRHRALAKLRQCEAFIRFVEDYNA